MSTNLKYSCYRLYIGHGNWINLNSNTSQDLLKIFKKGEPCRYELYPGLMIDIIPNDVDCNSKNIDMVGLMRADLVYDTTEYNVQQLMSNYTKSLLDEQGIIDAFPPAKKGEDLPLVTTLPTHRHLSLVPSIVGTVRRGPKSSKNNLYDCSSSSSSISSTNTIKKKNKRQHEDQFAQNKKQVVQLGSSNISFNNTTNTNLNYILPMDFGHHSDIWPSTAATSFDLNGTIDFNKRRSPTHILNQYENGNHQFMLQQHHTNVSSDTNSLESFVPTSPLQNWLEGANHHMKKEEKQNNWFHSKSCTTGDSFHHLEKADTSYITALPVIERLILQHDNSNDNMLFSHNDDTVNNQ